MQGKKILVCLREHRRVPLRYLTYKVTVESPVSLGLQTETIK